MEEGRDSRWWVGLVVLAVAATAAIATVASGVPASLPAVALSSTVLFHVERAVAVFVPSLLVFAAVYRGWRGELPAEFGRDGMKYSDEAAGLDSLRNELREVERQVTALRHAMRSDDIAHRALADGVRRAD